MSAPLGEGKACSSRCLMSGGRIFCYYEDGTWSLDATSGRKTLNRGEFDFKAKEL